ncbi:WGR domain-containing protein [Tenacibaculum ovolyticum]|uniref:WGR domain-containing protein n=1 Tax=Tenacibaculum ovolyticum TaxID=104270 RepID=UPI003BAA38A5
MKLIKQKKLYFSDEKSDKVYEVDLCESQDLFVVNFRYGRRGANLREGTKTVFPVSYEEAQKTFNSLVESKEKKGYSEILQEAIKVTESLHKDENTARKETILKYLNQAIKGTYTRNWKVSKIIARVGVLKIREAIPQIAQFIYSSDEFEQYNTINVLAEFNQANYVAEILTVFKDHHLKSIVGRVACAYILRYGSAKDKQIVHAEVTKHISEEEITSLALQFVGNNKGNPMFLFYAYLYAYDNNSLRDELFKLLEKVPLKVNTFKSIRYIYRAACVINDTRFFALLAKQIAIGKPGYTSEYPSVKGEWVYAFEEKKKQNPGIAFSGKTKDYFTKNSYKNIYNLSVENQESYIQYATDILCVLDDDEDQVNESVEHDYVYNTATRNYDIEKKCYPKYHQFSALMYILYGSSSRFKEQKNKWYYIENTTNEVVREEMLSSVWNQKPSEVLYILANAKSTIAVDFCLRIIKDNAHFLENLSDEIFSKLLAHKHPKVLDLVTALLEAKYATSQPEETILITLLASKNDKAVTLGLKWLQKYEASYLINTSLVTELLLTDEVLVITYLTEVYKNSVAYDTIIAIDYLQELFKEPSTYSFNFLIAVNNLIGNTLFGKLLSDTSVKKIVELAASNSVTNKLFAINLAKHNVTPAYDLFKENYKEYITSEEEVLRTAGIELLAHFPDKYLIENKQDIVSFCFSEYSEVRKAIRPTVDRLTKLDSDFKDSLLKQLLAYITEAENYEGLHENCYETLIQLYGADLKELSKEGIITLVLSKYEFAQKLGTPLFESNISMSALSMPDLIRLAHSDVFSIRTRLQAYFKNNVARVNYELEEALPIFNTNWQDVIDWGCDYFSEHIDAKNWTVQMLLYVCDHVKEQVQYLGRTMAVKHFSEEKGLPLLVSLQEHPAKSMQFFTTNYLNTYASDNVAVILKLEDYFKTTLFYINSNRATKTRVYSFLEKESEKYKEVALMTVRILNTILDTKTVTDKDKIIDILLTISEKHSDVAIPLLIK